MCNRYEISPTPILSVYDPKHLVCTILYRNDIYTETHRRNPAAVVACASPPHRNCSTAARGTESFQVARSCAPVPTNEQRPAYTLTSIYNTLTRTDTLLHRIHYRCYYYYDSNNTKYTAYVRT